ncbi:hypothetical protein HPP92_028447 [Vanilla planifolia]|uniref:Uncharacterized protein n=1 Tax=Vanilla planifolia TaxID=51239 RepID=A0A835P5D8_VANPL|nr:hypothetical protein HPP92_028447 [Vanilla planifolia]
MSVLDMRRRVLPGQALGGHMRRHRQPLVAKKESLDLKLPAPSEGEQCYSDGLSRLRQWLLVSKGPFFSLRRRWCIAITEQRKCSNNISLSKGEMVTNKSRFVHHLNLRDDK